jgi:hypothetical protein
MKSEKEALDNVRRSLENELDRSRVEVNNLRLQNRESSQDVKSSFEVEKLLAALGTTIDQVHTYHPLLSSDNLRTFP